MKDREGKEFDPAQIEYLPLTMESISQMDNTPLKRTLNAIVRHVGGSRTSEKTVTLSAIAEMSDRDIELTWQVGEKGMEQLREFIEAHKTP